MGFQQLTSCELTPRRVARGVASAGVLTMYCTMGSITGESAFSRFASTGTSAMRLSSATAHVITCSHAMILIVDYYCILAVKCVTSCSGD